MLKQLRAIPWFFAGIILFFILTIPLSIYMDSIWVMALPFTILLLYFAWQYTGLCFLLLIASLPFSFEFNFTASLGTDIPDEGLMWLLSFLFMARWIHQPEVLKGKTIRHPLIILLLVHLTWIGISTALSTDLLLSFKYFLAKGWYIGAFVLGPLILFRERKWIFATGITLALSMLLATLISVFRQANQGFRFAEVNEALSPFFRNHVNYSAMLVCMFPLFYCMYRLTTNALYRTWTRYALIFLGIALFLSFARGAWLALLTGSIAWWLIRKRLLVTSFVFLLALVTISVFWLKSGDRYLRYAHDYRTTIFHKDFEQHLVATYKMKDVSTAERFYRWIAGARMIKEHYLNGFGPNTFYENYKPYAMPAYKTWVSANPEHSTVHNYFLLLLIEQGIPGCLFFLILLGTLFYYCQRYYHEFKDPVDRELIICLGMMLVMIATVNFLSDLVETDKVGSLFFLCLATIVSVGIKRSEPATNIQGIS